MSLSLKTRKVEDVVVLDLSGKLTIGEPVLQLRETLRTFTTEGARKFILNLGDVGYIDSSGLAVLIETMQGVEEYGGMFALAGMQETVRSIFEIARLDQVFRIFPDVNSALAAS